MLVELIQSWRKGKKWAALFDDYKTVHFGAKNYQDYTIHKDPERMKRYIKRHSKEDWTNPYTPATLSRYILWQYPDLSTAIDEYNNRFFKSGSGLNKSDIHSVAFERDYWTTEQARQWLKKHDLVPIKRADKTVNTLRYRIIDPKEFKSFITKKLDNHINLIIGFY